MGSEIEKDEELISNLRSVPLSREEIEKTFPLFSPATCELVLSLESKVRTMIADALDDVIEYDSWTNWAVQIGLSELGAYDLFEGLTALRSGFGYAIGVEDPLDGILRGAGISPELKPKLRRALHRHAGRRLILWMIYGKWIHRMQRRGRS